MRILLVKYGGMIAETVSGSLKNNRYPIGRRDTGQTSQSCNLVLPD